MTSLSHLASASITEVQLFSFLSIADFPRLQVTNAGMKASVRESSAWHGLICQALPGFSVDSALARLPLRRQLLCLLPKLASTTVLQGVKVPIASIAQAQKVASAHSATARANSTTSGSAANASGAAECVVVGRLHFPRDTLETALENLRLRSPAHDDTDSCLSSSIAFPVPEAFAYKNGLPTSELRIHLAWMNGTMFMTARDNNGEAPPPLSSATLAAVSSTEPSDDLHALQVDLRSMASNVFLHHRGITALVNGPWMPSMSGLCSFSGSKEAARRALAEGLTCILCVRGPVPPGALAAAGAANAAEARNGAKKTGQVARALHLDTIRWERQD